MEHVTYGPLNEFCKSSYRTERASTRDIGITVHILAWRGCIFIHNAEQNRPLNLQGFYCQCEEDKEMTIFIYQYPFILWNKLHSISNQLSVIFDALSSIIIWLLTPVTCNVSLLAKKQITLTEHLSLITIKSYLIKYFCQLGSYVKF